ncbi:MAG: acyl-CoA dehydrogenase family protein [Anaerolineae bacterium]
MDFSLTEEQRMFQELFRDFAQNEVAPLADQIDREERTPVETLKKAAEMELMGLPIPPEYGGAGLDTLSYCLFMEELGKVCLSTATTISVHVANGCVPIYLDGTEEQKQKYLVPLARGEKIAAFALTEPEAGSDAARIQTTAIRNGDHYVLNGTKIWIMNGDIADTIVVFATTDPEAGTRGITAFIVEKDFPGFKVGRRERKMGLRGSSTNQLFFDDCPVPAENVLGEEEGKGFITALKSLDFARLSMGAICLGVAEGALAQAVEFATTREQFGGPIALKGAIQSYIADMATEIEALRYLIYHTAWTVDQGQRYTRLASMSKLYGSEVAWRVVNKAVQIHGGSGYVKDYPIERVYRDVRITRIFEGTNEIQRFVIASHIFREKGIRIQP